MVVNIQTVDKMFRLLFIYMKLHMCFYNLLRVFRSNQKMSKKIDKIVHETKSIVL